MIAASHIPLSFRSAVKPVYGILAGYLVIAIVTLYDYLSFQSLFTIAGLAALVFTGQVRRKQEYSTRFGWAVLAGIVLCMLMPVKTLLYFTICFALLFLIETFYGKTGILPLLVLVLISPVFHYLVNTFSFPIRLTLTAWAGTIFNAIGMDTVVRGNVMIRDGSEFSVDPGCIGLSMMETSLLLGVVFLAFYERKGKKHVRMLSLLLYFSCIVLLNIAANLFRIILLVQFRILPGTLAHEIAGVACVLVYVFIPAVFLARFFVNRSPQLPVAVSPKEKNVFPVWVHVLLLVCICVLAIGVLRADTYQKFNRSKEGEVNGYVISEYAPGILKLQGKQSLIYIKYIRGFYDTDHNPMLCWTGSGYTVEQVEQQQTGSTGFYTGMLVNGNERLYSAWWYSDGRNATVDQLAWRWDMLKNRKIYAVINVTCATPDELNKEINNITNNRVLSSFFNKYH